MSVIEVIPEIHLIKCVIRGLSTGEMGEKLPPNLLTSPQKVTVIRVVQ